MLSAHVMLYSTYKYCDSVMQAHLVYSRNNLLYARTCSCMCTHVEQHINLVCARSCALYVHLL
jgi:hypothetical protein